MSTESLMNGYVVTREGARQVREVMESKSIPVREGFASRFVSRREDRRVVLGKLNDQARRSA